MPCYEPLYARLIPGASATGKTKVVFDRKDHDSFYYKRIFPESQVSGLSIVPLPCSKCFGCKKERARQWSLRCVHEASDHEESSFVTLTFSDESFDRRGSRSVEKRDVQLFMKRLRKRFSDRRIRVFMFRSIVRKVVLIII